MPVYYVPMMIQPAQGGGAKNGRWLSQSCSDKRYNYVDPETRALFEPYQWWYNWGARPEDLDDPRFVPMAFSCVFPKCVKPGRALYLVGNEMEDRYQGNTMPEVAVLRWRDLLTVYDIDTMIFGGWLHGADWLRAFLAECKRLNIALPVEWHIHGYTYPAGDTYQAETPERVIARWEELFGMVDGPWVISEYGSTIGCVDDFLALDNYLKDHPRVVGRCPFTVEVKGNERWYPGSWPKPAKMALVDTDGSLTAVGIEYCKTA